MAVRKVIARRQDKDRFRVNCPRCAKVHIFKQVTNTTFVLNGDLSDHFRLIDHTDPYLYPEFVCVNPNCSYEGTVMFEVSK